MTFSPRRWLLLLPLVLLAGCTPPPTVTFDVEPVDVPSPVAALADSLLIAPLEARGASVSLVVGDARTGDIQLAHDADRLRLPASVQKLFVAADALLRLPRDDRLTTEVYGSGPLDSAGVLHGDLVIRGGWDPSLSGNRPYSDWPWARLDSLATRLHALGLRQIRGDVVVEAAAYIPAPWEIGDLEYRYAPRIASLMWNDGLVSHTQQIAGLQGSTVLTNVWPDPVFWTVDHNTVWPRAMAQVVEPEVVVPVTVETVTGARPGSARADSTLTGETPGSSSETLSSHSERAAAETSTGLQAALSEPGRVRSGELVDVRDRAFARATWEVRRRPSPFPRVLAGDAFRAALARSGIRGGDSTRVIEPGFPPVPYPARDGFRLETHSAPLDTLLTAMLKISSNAWAEQLAAAAGSWTKDGRNILTWPSVLDSLNLSGGEGLNAADACGMARRNRMRAVTVHELLLAAHERWGTRWLSLLAGAQEPGTTLEERLAGLEGRFLGKTGTLSDCRSLAGYLLDETGKPAHVVTIFVNQAPENPEPWMDAFVTALAALERVEEE